MIFEYKVYKSPWFYLLLTLFIGFIGWHFNISYIAHPFWFVAGLILLVKTADILIEGSAKLARHYGVSPLIVGLTVVAFGTSLPELVVSVLAALQGNSGISIGNIIGSNIANIGLIVGVAAIITPLIVNLSTIKKEAPIMILVSFVLYFLSFNMFFDFSDATYTIGRIDGVILLVIFAGFLCYMFYTAGRQRAQKAEEQFEKEFKGKRESVWKFMTMILIGLVGLTAGAKLMVFSASEIARGLGISDVVIGVTIVALGTSLPELAAAISATRKKEADIVIGNVIGSNIFNILLVLGATTVITPISIASSILRIDMIIMIVFAAAVYIAMSNDHKISKNEGIALLIGYALYILYVALTTIF